MGLLCKAQHFLPQCGVIEGHWGKYLRIVPSFLPRCELSVAGMEPSEAILRPCIEETISIFGWDRVVFGSDVPIETMAGSFAQWTGG